MAVVNRKPWYHMKGNTEGFPVVLINMCYVYFPNNQMSPVLCHTVDIYKYTKNKTGKKSIFYFWWGVTWMKNNCHWYFLVPILFRNVYLNVDQVNIGGGGFFSYCHFCTFSRFYDYSE